MESIPGLHKPLKIRALDKVLGFFLIPCSVLTRGHKEMSSVLADQYQPHLWGGGCVVGSRPMSTAVHNAHGAQINFGDLTPYLT